jgi:hypothetical protein
MRDDIKKKKYTDIYNKIGNIYSNEYLSINKACNKIGITERYYYKICKELGYNSVASNKETNKSLNLKKMNIQKGGNKSNVFIYDEQDNDIGEAAKEQIRRLKDSTK